MKYDDAVLEKYANRLYDKAVLSVILHIGVGCVVGGLIGYLPEIVWFWTKSSNPPPPTATVLGAIVGAVIFGVIGNERSFRYRLQAQITLCQVQIERNTRQSSRSAP